ncbi:MAG: hypothetical protein QOJ15_931 [Bradyrhizobium sp.]|jgi:hypothetical protein|nr:hypothetical protein [Bradyrhizobium sp.]
MPGQRGAERGASKSLSDRRKRPYLLRFSTPQVAGPDLLRDLDSRYRASARQDPRGRLLFLVDGLLHISRKAPARKAHGRAIWSPTSTAPIATARRARFSPGARSRPPFRNLSGRAIRGLWHLAGRPPKHQFSRDIASASGYLMASRRARLYTAPIERTPPRFARTWPQDRCSHNQQRK